MASGDTLLVFTAAHNQPPSASFATFDTRNGILVLDFDGTADESAIFGGVLPRNYAGGGLTVILHWMASAATTNACGWLTAFERMNTDEDADSFATANSVSTTTNGTSGIITASSIAHASGAEMDSLAAGEPFRLKVTRDGDGSVVTDSMLGDAELFAVEIQET